PSCCAPTSYAIRAAGVAPPSAGARSSSRLERSRGGVRYRAAARELPSPAGSASVGPMEEIRSVFHPGVLDDPAPAGAPAAPPEHELENTLRPKSFGEFV